MAKTLKEYKEWDNPSVSVAAPQGLKTLSGAERSQVVDTKSAVEQIISSRLGPIPDSGDSVELTQLSQQSEEYEQALANLITDINQDYRVSNGVIEHNNKKTKVTSILRDLQPHREHPSKDRSKRFAAGDLQRDAAIPENHDVV